MSCAAAMEVAIRQRLEGVADVRISETDQTAEVTFAPGDHPFSLEAFRTAVQQADVEIVSIDLDACGTIEGGGDARPLQTGRVTLLLQGAEEPAAGSPVCVTGRLESGTGDLRMRVSRIEPAPDLQQGG